MADSEHRRPTVRDVARAARVSVATVSRAFAKPDEVSVETRHRVVEVARRMGYRFNRLAVDFRRGSTRTVIVLVTDITNSFFSEFFKGIEEEARSRDFISLMGDTSGDPRSEDIYVGMLASGRGDGLILNTSHFPSSLVAEITGPVVSCNPVAERTVPTLTIDFAAGGRLAAEHLIGLGHSRIAQVCGPLEAVAITARRDGFNATLANAGIATDSALTLMGSLGIGYGMEAAERLMAASSRPTAIFAHNDETALGIVHALSKLGVRVPRDVSVIGYDDLSFSVAMSPALTTIRLPRREWGRAACRALLDIIEGHPTPATMPIIVPQLIVRESTAPARRG